MTKLVSQIRWVAMGLVIIVVTVVGLVWFSLSQSVELERATDWVAHTNSVLYHATSLQSSLSENQARVRDFIFTGKQEIENLLPANENEIDSGFTHLSSLVSDNPVQKERMTKLRRMIDNRVVFSREQVRLYNKYGRDTVLRIASSGDGIRFMDSIRVVLSAIRLEETVLLVNRTKANEKLLVKLSWVRNSVFILVLLFLFLVFLFIGQQIRLAKRAESLLRSRNVLLETEVEQKKNEIIGTLERSSDFFISLDKNWRIVYVNKRAANFLNLSPEELQGKNFWHVFPDNNDSELEFFCNRSVIEQVQFETTFFESDKRRWLEVYGYPDSSGISLFIHDFTDRKYSELRLEKVNRLYHFVSQISQMIIRVDSNEALCREACEIAVSVGKFPLVGISLVKNNGDLGISHISTDRDTYRSLLLDGPEVMNESAVALMGKAFNEKKLILVQDFQEDPELENWRVQCNKLGLKSTIVIPLCEADSSLGVIAFFSGETLFFDLGEIELIEGVSRDISFALGIVRKERLRSETEMELRERNQFISGLIDISPDIIYIYDLKMRSNVYINREIFRGLGYVEEEIRAMGDTVLKQIMHPDDYEKYIRDTLPSYSQLPDGRVLIQEFRVRDTQGRWHWFYCKEIIYRRDKEGKPEQVFGLLSDITGLKNTELELRRSEEKYRSMVNRISDGFIVIDTSWNYVYVNSQIEKMVHKSADELVGRNVWEVFPDAIGSNTYLSFKRALEEQIYQRCVDYYPPLDLWQENHIYPSPEGLAVFIIDISHRKRVENELEQSELKYRLLFELSPVPLWIYSMRDLRIIDVNKAAVRFYGYTREEFLKLTIFDLRPPEYHEKLKEASSKFYGGYHYGGIWKHRKKDGSLADVEILSHETLFDQEPVRITLALDITAKLEAQEQLQQSLVSIRKLSDHLQSVREEERKRISREIHDELGQHLTAMKMDTVWIQRKLGALPEAIEVKFTNILNMLNASNLAIRRILRELRMGVLDELGLVEALQWQGRQFSEQTGIGFAFFCENVELDIPDSIAVCIYRLLQEGLTNVGKHAAAKEVHALLRYNDNKIIFQLSDDGVGFDKKKVSEKIDSFGILGMKERVLALDGTFEISSSPDKGTIIKAVFPLH